jgi:hypothetical protein
MRTAGIATLKERELSFHKTIDSIYDQVDKIIAVLNYYRTIPTWLSEYPKVEYHFGMNALGAAGKFLCVSQSEGCYFSIDDDLQYPPDYCEYMIDGINRHKCIVSLHGRVYPIPVVNFRKWIRAYRCLGDVTEDVMVNLGGTGCMAFDTAQFKLNVQDLFQPKNMVDCHVAREAWDQKIPIVVLKHDKSYLKYTPPPERSTIWHVTSDKSKQTEVLKSFLK